MLESIIFNIWYWVLCFVLGAITQGIGKAKGKDNCFWWGFCLGIIGLLIVICMKSNNDVYGKLEKLQALKDAGTIDEVEFEVYKSKILKENDVERYGGRNTNNGTGALAVIVIIVAIIVCIIIFPNLFGKSNTVKFLQKEVQELIIKNWRENRSIRIYNRKRFSSNTQTRKYVLRNYSN